MKKVLFAIILFASCTAFAFSQTNAQTRPILAILPFVGGTEEDGDSIATLLSFQPEITSAFTIVPRTAVRNAIFGEHDFQLGGLTDADTIAGIGHMLNADFVLSGNIRRLGNRNLVIATIIHVESFEQVAGYYLTYRRTIEEIRRYLPSMSSRMVAAALRDTPRISNLAVFPLRVEGISAEDAETLAKILAIEIINFGDGSYAVLPRTSAIESALMEKEFGMSGYVADEEMAAVGQAFNAQYVLSIGTNSLGGMDMFTAHILDVRRGISVAGGYRRYQNVSDAINLMAELAILLTDPENADERIAKLRRQRRFAELFGNTSRFWSVGIYIGTSFAEPWVVGSLQATFAPLRHSFIRVGCDVGFISGIEDVSYFSICPSVHYALFLPFARGGWHVGIGGGLMIEKRRFDVLGSTIRRGRVVPVADFATGFFIGNIFNISYTLRTDFSMFIHKAAIGFTYRFQTRSK